MFWTTSATILRVAERTSMIEAHSAGRLSTSTARTASCTTHISRGSSPSRKYGRRRHRVRRKHRKRGETNQDHFEWHPHDGPAVDPFSLVTKACKQTIETVEGAGCLIRRRDARSRTSRSEPPTPHRQREGRGQSRVQAASLDP